MNERILALADYLGVDPTTLKEGCEDTVVETDDGEEYYVVTEDEALELASDSIRNFIYELGITNFTPSFLDWILENAVEKDWFDDAMRESMEFYFDDILNESSDTFESRAVEELYECGILTDDDFEQDEDGEVDYTRLSDDIDPADYKDDFVEHHCGDEDSVEWFRNNFGDEEFSETVTRHNLYDEQKVIDEAIEWDGIAHFVAIYDGEEIELSDGYYAYRTN